MLYTVLWSDVSRVISRPSLPLFLARTLKRLGEPGNEANGDHYQILNVKGFVAICLPTVQPV